MKRRIIGVAVILFFAIVVINFLQPQEPQMGEEQGLTNETLEIPVSVPEDNEIGESPLHTGWRDFYLGFTPFPYDVTQDAIKETYGILDEHSDLVCHHFDSGVPWVETSTGEDYHQKVMWDINQRVSYLTDSSVVYLALTPLNGDRSAMAGNWGEQGNQPLPEEWLDFNFNDSMVIETYLSYCQYMIDKFDPEYLAYGIEVNMLAATNPESFEYYVGFIEQVYPSLKENYPELPVFLSIQTEYYLNNPGQDEAVQRILPYTDYLALSSYPFSSMPDPSDIPIDYYTKITELAPEKPFCFAETGFPSETTVIEGTEISIPGNPEGQTEFVDYIFNSSETLDSEFIVWFVLADYDATWEVLKEMGMDPIYRLWIETGLIDENLAEKPAMNLWDEWLSKTRLMD